MALVVPPSPNCGLSWERLGASKPAAPRYRAAAAARAQQGVDARILYSFHPLPQRARSAGTIARAAECGLLISVSCHSAALVRVCTAQRGRP